MVHFQASQGSLRDERDVEAELKKIPVKAGAGKLKVGSSADRDPSHT
jgi:hypothetical protein